ncbi:MAG: hypothetical protein ABIS38_01645, partial [Sphingomicrobium sp.]
VGAHIFYRWAGGWGQPGAFAKSYGGHEPTASLLRSAALAAEAATAPAQNAGGIAEVIAKVPGAERLAPSMRGDKRVAVRFNLTARKASNDAPHEAYVEKFKTSDSLRWALSNDSAAAGEKPLGTPATGGGSATVAAQR